MAEENNDANTDTGTEAVTESVESTGPSPDVEDFQPVIDEDGLVSTTEFKAPGEPVEEGSETDDSDPAEQNTEEGDPSKTDFHEHPRFKELISEKNDLKATVDKLTKEIAGFKANPAQAKPKPQSQPTYDNLLAMDEGDLAELMADNPRGFIQKLGQQMFHEINAENERISQARTFEDTQAKARSSVGEFFDARPDGQEMLVDGRIEKLMQENPMHNPISAYYELTSENMIPKADSEKAIEEAVKEAETKIYRKLKAKGAAGSASTTKGGMSLGDNSPEVRNPEKFGGAKAVAVKRFLSRMAG